MNVKRWFLVLTACLLGTLYVVYFTDWLVPGHIQILVQNRPGVMARRAVSPIAFMLDHKYRLTRIEVVPLDAAAAEKTANPTWELDSSSNSLPVQGFFYGQTVRGMKGEPQGHRAEPLTPGGRYRLLVQAGRTRGEAEFRAPEALNAN